MLSEQIKTIHEDCRSVVADRIGDLADLRGSQVLILGGTGFVGVWLTELLAFLNDHHDFRVRIILMAAHAHDMRAEKPHLADRDDVRLIESDVRGLSELPANVDWVIHAAASPDNRFHASNPIRTLETNVQGTLAVLAAAARLPDLRKLLYLSSGVVYGDLHDDIRGIPEDHFGGADCHSFASAYAEGKRAAETLCASFRSQQGLPIVVARPFAFIGPYQLLDRPWAVNNFLRDGLLGGPIRIQGDGTTVRSYMYGADMAYWLLRILVGGRSGAAYNVGSPHGICLRDLAAKIAQLVPSRPRIEIGKLCGGRTPRAHWAPDVSLAVRELGLDLRVDLDAALARTVRWNQAKERAAPAARAIA